MSAPDSGARELCRGLVEALRPALPPGAPRLARLAARDVAQLMGLPGLEAAIGELERHAGASRPRELGHLAERIARLADRVEELGEVAPFVEADAELAALASHLAGTEWGAPAAEGAPAVPTLAAAEALDGLALEGLPDVGRARLSLPVASALRAALDWLGLEEGARVRGETHDSALTLTVRGVHEAGLGPAGAVLAAVEGSLARDREGRWTLRIPSATERPSFLLLRQGHLGFALAWHAVARLRMLAEAEREKLAAACLDPLVTPQPTGAERPAALLALGLASAWFVADRVVWRIAALPREMDEPAPVPGARAIVEMENGERYWVLDVGWLLRAVTPLATPPPLPRPRPAGAATVAPGAPTAAPSAAAPSEAPSPRTIERAVVRDVVSPAPAAPPPVPMPPAPEPAAPETVDPESEALARAAERALATLRAELATAAPPLIAPAPAPPQRVAAPAPAPRASSPSPARRALVADDSIVARMFLTRMLEKRGWVVASVPDAAGLWEELVHGPWELVCADFALPDAQGSGHVTRLLDYLGRCAAPPACIVLTRDAEDERVAREAGATRMLRKPFEPDRLDALLPR